MLFTAELQRRLSAVESTVIAVTAPVPATPPPTCRLPARAGNRWMDAMNRIGNRLFAQSEAAGALSTLYAAVAPIPGNSYVGSGGFLELRGAPKLVGRSEAARDAQAARRLWEVSEDLTERGFV